MKYYSMLYIKITTLKNLNYNQLTLFIEDENHIENKNVTINLTYPLEMINGISDELIIPVLYNGVINQAYIKRLIFKEETSKEEIIKEYLEIPNILLFKGVNYIKTNCKNFKIEMESNNEHKWRKVL
mgnify:CR=1 FL=1